MLSTSAGSHTDCEGVQCNQRPDLVVVSVCLDFSADGADCVCADCCQVVGPAAAGIWLASIAAFMHLQYHFIRCSDFNRLHLPAKAWLLSTLGKSARCTLNPASVNGAHLFGPFSVSQHRSNLTANKGI